MKELNNHDNLVAFIKHYQPELLAEVAVEMRRDLWASAAYRRNQLNAASDQFLKDIVRVLKEAKKFQGLPPEKPFLLDEARKQIRLHFLAQRLFMKGLRKLAQASDKEWLGIYYMLTQVFHNILRPKVAMGCANCRCAMEEDLARAQKMESDLKKALS